MDEWDKVAKKADRSADACPDNVSFTFPYLNVKYSLQPLGAPGRVYLDAFHGRDILRNGHGCSGRRQERLPDQRADEQHGDDPREKTHGVPEPDPDEEILEHERQDEREDSAAERHETVDDAESFLEVMAQDDHGRGVDEGGTKPQEDAVREVKDLQLSDERAAEHPRRGHDGSSQGSGANPELVHQDAGERGHEESDRDL